MKTFVTIFILLYIQLKLSGQIPSEKIIIGEKITIPSKVLNEDRQILIRLPQDYEYSNERYPVLYVLDGEFFFHQANSAVNFLSECSYIYNNPVPKMIVVALVNVDRNRDYTPTYAPNQLGSLYYPTSGKADLFLEFLEKELLPEIDDNYRTQPFKTLAGWSFGGLFTVHTFTNKPELFSAYLAISPSLWWDEDMYVSKFDSVFKNYQFLPKKLTITCGTLEGGSIGRSVKDGFVPIIKKRMPNDYQFNFVEIPDEGHSFVPYKAFYEGLASIFSDFRIPLENVNEGYESIKKYYSELSESYGYEINISEWAFMNLINNLNAKDKHKEAMEIAKKYQLDYPQSSWPILLVGRTYEHMGNYDKAKENYELAIKNENSKPEPDSERIISFTMNLNLLIEKQKVKE
jgi:predicted alpha/beta superfamily hydrolase